ncbi:MAG: hypothetical protein N3A57_08000, partial [Negativicutes bacterium]|nr:hypothetical protein [Negativicutes bacterium]
MAKTMGIGLLLTLVAALVGSGVVGAEKGSQSPNPTYQEEVTLVLQNLTYACDGSQNGQLLNGALYVV